MINPVINFLLPNRCVVCDKVIKGEGGVCQDCFNSLNFISKPHCQKCGYPFIEGQSSALCANCLQNNNSAINLTRSVLIYDEVSKKMIIDFKFFDKTQNLKILGKWLYMSADDIIKSGVDVIIPVPLHFIRLIKRKYNQAGLLAKELGKLSKTDVDYFSLKKAKYTKPQTKFAGNPRRKNIKNSFVIKNPNNIKGKKVLLVDDVMTTGSTLNECAKVLIKAGAKEVNIITVARVLN